MNRHGDGVFHIEKIAHLVAVGVVGVVTLKQPDLAGGLDLFEGFSNQTAHIVLVRFVGAENIVIFEPNDVLVPAHALGIAVKHVLGIAIHVEWSERM